MAEDKKAEKKNGYTVRYTNKGHKVVDMPVSGFPHSFFEEWNRDCKERFLDLRWLKIWHDHEVAKILDALTNLKKYEVKEVDKDGK